MKNVQIYSIDGGKAIVYEADGVRAVVSSGKPVRMEVFNTPMNQWIRALNTGHANFIAKVKKELAQ